MEQDTESKQMYISMSDCFMTKVHKEVNGRKIAFSKNCAKNKKERKKET